LSYQVLKVQLSNDPALLLSFSIKEAAQEINIRNGVSEEQFQLEEIIIMLDNFEPKATTQILEKIVPIRYN